MRAMLVDSEKHLTFIIAGILQKKKKSQKRNKLSCFCLSPVLSHSNRFMLFNLKKIVCLNV